MKTMICALGALVLFGGAVLADDRDSTWQPGTQKQVEKDNPPSGYEIRGCAHYESVNDHKSDSVRVKQICNEQSVDQFFARAEDRAPSGGGGGSE